MKLKQIKMDDIVPDENNPREDFGDLYALAKTFEFNPYAPGQPYNAIVVVEDGSIYRIVDGERRYRAMKINNIDACSAIVCGDYEEADSMVAMLASDDKEPLNDIERSKGIQRALLLGVPQSIVEDASKMKKRQIKKISSILESKGTVVQATLDQILEAYDLREVGAKPEDVERVLEAEEEDWSTIAHDVRQRMADDKFHKDAKRIIENAGYDVVDDEPDDKSYRRMFFAISDLEKALDDGISEDVIYWISRYPRAVYVYSASDADATDKNSAENAKKIDIALNAIEEGIRNRVAWYAAALDTDKKGERIKLTPNVDKLLIKRASIGRVETHFRELAETNAPKHQPKILYGSCAEVLFVQYPSRLNKYDLQDILLSNDIKNHVEYYVNQIEWIDAFIADGYELTSEESSIYDTLRQLIEDCIEDVPEPLDEDPKAGDTELNETHDSATYESTSSSRSEITIELDEVVDASKENSKVVDELDISSLALDGMAVA